MEQWKTILDHPNYEISSLGKIRNIKRGRLLKPQLDKGYYRVHLSTKGKVTVKPVHRLVAEAFVDGYREGLQVNHINGCKTRNDAGNLEWVTYSENLLHAYETGLREPPCPNPIPVEIIETGDVFGSYSECARYINGSKRHLGECVEGIRQTHKGYHFRKFEENREGNG